ncbi:MAG: DUF7352 domain-containing protein [Janthinobacterium lividum]
MGGGVVSGRAIHKHVVKVADEIRIYVPHGAPLLLVAHQPDRMRADEIGFWFEVPADLAPDACLSPQVFYVVGTGNPVPDGAVSLMSLIAGPFVWHLYRPIASHAQVPA